MSGLLRFLSDGHDRGNSPYEQGGAKGLVLQTDLLDGYNYLGK